MELAYADVITPAGSGLDDFWAALVPGKSLAEQRFRGHPICAFTDSALNGLGVHTRSDLIHRLIESLLERMNAALHLARSRVGVIVASTTLGIDEFGVVGTVGGDIDPGSYERRIRGIKLLCRESGLGGPVFFHSSACASTITAITQARTLLFADQVDAVAVIAVDVLLDYTLKGFHSLRIMAPENALTLLNPGGVTLGEGAAALVFSKSAIYDHAGTKVPVNRVLGVHAESSVNHVNAPSLDSIRHSIVSCLNHASNPAIDVVFPHATGTAANDGTEWKALREALGHVPAVVSTKQVFGHTQACAGALSIAAARETIKRQMLPAFDAGEDYSDAQLRDFGLSRSPRDVPVKNCLINAFGFGAINASVIVSGEGNAEALSRSDVKYGGAL